MRIGERDLRPLAVGCGLLGAGGGGDWRLGRMLAERLVADHGAVTLIDVSELPDEALILPVAMIGAPTVSAEKLGTGREADQLRSRVERMLGRRVDALMAAEIGGMNGLLPVGWAASAGLPLVNADGMGRAFPQLGMSSMRLAGLPASPVLIVDERDNTATFETTDDAVAERLARASVAALGGSAAMALPAMTALQARDAVIAGTVTRALDIGLRLERSRIDNVDAVLEHTGGGELMRGKIIDVKREITNGFARGAVTVEAVGDPQRMLHVEFQNENLIALEGGEVVAAVPDIIAVVDTHHGTTIATESLRYGQRVAVLTLPCAPLWRTDEALAIVGPQAFGYSIAHPAVAR